MGTKKNLNPARIFLHISLALIILAFISGTSLCQHRSHIDPTFKATWIQHIPGEWYTLIISYPSAAESLEGNDVQISLSAVPKSLVGLGRASSELGSRFGSDFTCDVEVKSQATDPIIVLNWEMINEELAGKGKKPSGSQKIEFP